MLIQQEAEARAPKLCSALLHAVRSVHSALCLLRAAQHCVCRWNHSMVRLAVNAGMDLNLRSRGELC